MKGLILSFFVVIGLFCGFVNAQSQMSAPVESDDLTALWNFLVENNALAKGEFEKTTDYNNRVRTALTQTVYGNLRGDSTWTAISPMIYHTYDADSETLYVTEQSYRFDSRACNKLNMGEIGLIFVNHDSFFRNPKPPWFEKDDLVEVGIKVSPSEAQSIKSNYARGQPQIMLAYRFHLLISESRVKCIFTNRAINVWLDSIVLFDSVTGKVYYESTRQKPKTVTPSKKTTTTTPVKKTKTPLTKSDNSGLRTSEAVSGTSTNDAEVASLKEKVSIQIKNLSKFTEIYGKLAKNLESTDSNIKSGAKLSPETVKSNNQSKQVIITSLGNVRTGLRKLEMDVQTNPSLKNYVELFKGISDSVGVAENLAVSGEFTKSNATLSNLVEKLKNILIAIG